MSESNPNPVDSSANPAGEQDQKKDSVSYDSFQKVLKEKKAFQDKFETINAKLAELEKNDLAKSGKLEELVQKEREEKKALADKLSGMTAKLAKKAIQDSLKDEASKHGVLDVSDLYSALEIDSISVDPESYQVSQDDVKKYVESMKAKKPHWFKVGAKPNNDVKPNSSASTSNEQKTLSDMSADELKAELAKYTNK